MKKANLSESNNLFRQSVLFALIEQEKIDPTPLRAFLLRLLDAPQSMDEKIGWLLTEESSLNSFHNSLEKNGLVICNLEQFKVHFMGNQYSKAKIVWNANLNELVYLFTRLREEKIIPLHKNPHVLLRENFLDKYEKSIKAGSLRTLLDKGIRDDKRTEIIDVIIKSVTSYLR